MTSELLESAEEAAKEQNSCSKQLVTPVATCTSNSNDYTPNGMSTAPPPSVLPQTKPLNKARETYLRIKVY